ncbi:formylglycine-generating enzyme family protein [Neptuniibacter sp. QD37_11]|uniref:formylglycine-generating enzyme family protein n=1 Tax=Neptuniibacter sp. QD37_11 TaxID=3398209 RepID=UPI0039F5D270
MNKKVCCVAVLLSGFTSGVFAESSKIQIDAGKFQMGCSQGDKDCENDEGEPGGTAVHVPTFLIDKHEVTVAEYQACIEAGNCQRPKDHKRNKYCNLGAEGRGNHPINCVDWQQALDFCQTKGGRLPFEAEWEKAARANTLTRYPWGQEVSCKQAILDDGKTMGSVPNEPDGCGEDRTWPIGSHAENAYGLHDMHGNTGEWTMNWYAKNGLERYANGDLFGPDQGRQRVVRGGSWDEHKANLRSSFRNVKPPISGRSVYGSIGFRCAYDVK